MDSPDLGRWIEKRLGHTPRDLTLFERAVTHGSRETEDYQRLEFLGDRVLGLLIARWLYAHFANEPEGKLSRRLNVLVSGEICAGVARDIDLRPHLRLGKQARDDGAGDSDYVLGDVIEALIGALFLDGGLDAADAFVRSAWAVRLESQERAPQHPKSALQEWAAANQRKPPEYSVSDRSGPHHNPRFTVTVAIKNVGEASAEGSSKQEAETAAARALLEKLS